MEEEQQGVTQASTRELDDETVGDDLRRQRLAKLARFVERGVNPYPADSHRNATAAGVVGSFDELEGQEVSVAGRIMSWRAMGKATFAHLDDGTGRIQVYFRQDVVGTEPYQHLKDLDIGDIIEAAGRVFRTRTGEVTVEVHRYRLLAKALRTPPEKWHGITDVEKRYRQRYLDLLTNAEARSIFERRTKIISAMRRFLDERGFLEVETPALQPLYGGAAARPFETYHNALDRQLFLRIATELYLKRLIIGGFPKVYEIGKDFRNEGISTKHNPEFTMMESYQAYADYRDVMSMVEEMISYIARQVLGTSCVTFQGNEIELAPPWRRLSLREAILERTGVDFEQYPDQESLYPKALELGIEMPARTTWGQLVDELLSVFVEPNLIQPTFLTDYPVELSPLAKRNHTNPRLAERFEVFIGGLETGNAFSELNDPLDQRARFLSQVAKRAQGDEEAHVLDEDFLQALEYGMPPTGGLGIGVDRLVMLFTDQQSIREVILFPQLRSKD